MNAPVQQAASDYLARGWRPIRVEVKGKAPIGKAWQNTKPSVADFGPDENIGIMLGPKSNGLVDIDLDADEAKQLASLPDLFGGCPSFGREGLTFPGHYLLYCKDLGDNAKRHMFSPSGDFIDVRAGGGQTVFPPSEHEARIVWSGGRMPIEIPTWPWEELRKRARLVAFLSTCLKFYPGAGEHDNYVMPIAGALATWGIEPEVGTRLIRGLCEAAGDTHEINARTAKALTAWNKVQAGEKVTGFTYLSETYFEEEFTKKLKTYLVPKEEHTKTDPNAIWVDDPNVAAFTDAVAARIMECDPHLVFKRGGELVRKRVVETLETERDGAVIIHPGTVEIVRVKEAWLDYQVSKLGIQFYGYIGKRRRLQPPAGLDKRLIQVPDDLPFKGLLGISTTPTLGCSTPGYDEASKILHAFPERMFPT